MGILDIFFPKTCVGCGKWGAYICETCINGCTSISTPICPMCGKSSMFGEVHARCRKGWGMDGLNSALLYKGPVKTMVTKFKYRMVTDLFLEMCEIWWSLGEWENLVDKDWLVVGVPLHPQRLRWRGFNQADELGNKAAEYFGWQFKAGILQRTKNTPPQAKMLLKERQRNILNAFTCTDPQAIKERRVLLVDDVWTTGSTMRECAKILKRSGASIVWGLTFAKG